MDPYEGWKSGCHPDEKVIPARMIGKIPNDLEFSVFVPVCSLCRRIVFPEPVEATLEVRLTFWARILKWMKRIFK